MLSIWFPAVGEQKRQSWRVEESSRETNCHHRGGEKAGRTEWWWGAKRERKRARELEVESMEREEGERLVGTSESLKCTGGRERERQSEDEKEGGGCEGVRVQGNDSLAEGPWHRLSPGDQSAVGTRANQPKTVASPPQFSPFSLWKPSQSSRPCLIYPLCATPFLFSQFLFHHFRWFFISFGFQRFLFLFFFGLFT